MAASAPLRRQRGFTLMELLVVLVIVGILLGLASLTIGDNRGEEIKREADRLVALLRLARDEATLSGQPVGLHVGHDGYSFLSQHDQDTWTVMVGDKTLGPREMPEFVRLDMLVDGEPISPGGTGGGEDSDATELSGDSGPGLSDSADSGSDEPGPGLSGSSGPGLDDGDGEGEDGEDEPNAPTKEPHTVIYPSGEIYPFQLDVAGEEPGRYYRITGEIDGKIELETRD